MRWRWATVYSPVQSFYHPIHWLSTYDLERSIDIALDAYEGKTDKAGTTYIHYLLRVMGAMDTCKERIVAVLHEVFEDTDYTLVDIEDRFDRGVRDTVDTLTKRRGEDYIEYFIPRIKANAIARRVKIADIEDNMVLTRLDSVSLMSWKNKPPITLRGSDFRPSEDLQDSRG